MPRDPFTLLGLEQRFDLSENDIRKAWRACARKHHPDAAQSGEAPPDITRNAARYNDARHILLDPEQRADTLLVLLGGPSRQDETQLPADFLAQMMETRESFDEALESCDQQRITHWHTWAQQQRSTLLDTVAQAFESYRHSPDIPLLRTIRLELNKLRFIERMRDQISQHVL
jgi:molecular chaperone HscB